MNKCLLSILLICITVQTIAQNQSPVAPGNGNPIIPGYFADPTIKKFGDTYYIYATTDGNGGGLGPSQVWTSKDFINWTMQDMNWPTTHFYWAPDVTLGNDGKYYMYYCQPVEIYGASSSTPIGPWTPLNADGKAMIPNYFVPGVITLDGQSFRDDDGKFYMYWGTWGIYPDHGCGVGLLNDDMKTFSKTGKIPNTIAKDFFEAPFMFKRKGIYYLTYSSGACEDATYRVQYVMSKTGPMDGFTYGKNSPILVTNEDKSVHGPGHQSVIQVGDEFYMVYHRHNNPNAGGGFHRQIAVDRLVFDAEGNIEKLVPTHTGIGVIGTNTNPYPNIAYLKKVTASSFYNDDYKPAFAVDNNNGTLWRPATNSKAPASIKIDLGKETTIQRVLTEFEYATWYYQYRLDYSSDGNKWKTYADKTSNKIHGSPMVDDGNVKARYLRLTITGTENPGMYKAVWNIKVYSEKSERVTPAPNISKPEITGNTYQEKGLLIDIDANEFQPGTLVQQWKNHAALGGAFTTKGRSPVADVIGGKKAVVFNGSQLLESSFSVPISLSDNSSYTVSYWVHTKKVKEEAPVISWAFGGRDLNNAIFGYGKQQAFGAVQHGGFSDMQYRKVLPDSGNWHHVAVTFDGTFEKVFVDGQLNNQENKMLFIKTAKSFILGGKNNRQSSFSGAISSLQVYDRSLTEKEINSLYTNPAKSDLVIYLNAAKMGYGKLTRWSNEGTAQGELLATDQAPVVNDVAGRLAISFTGKEALVFNKTFAEAVNNNTSYSMAVSVYKPSGREEATVVSWATEYNSSVRFSNKMEAGKWYLVVKTSDGKNTKEYVDGILTSVVAVNKYNQSADLFIGTNNKNSNGFTGSISHLMVFNHTLSDEEINTLNSVWKANLHSPSANISFKRKPKAITPNIIQMEANSETTSGNLSFYFSKVGDDTKGEWVDNPYYMDYKVQPEKEYQYTFKIRDNFGNVTENVTPITVTTDLSDFTIQKDDFAQQKNYLEQGLNGSLWNGLIGNVESKAVKSISSAHNQLTLESEGSNWDGNLPYGPFLYTTVKGDFVAEVMVTDVSGLSQKKVTGNNEAGLMIRIPSDSSAGLRRPQQQMLQNGIFPAWNVGNLFTNFQNGRREQTNNQSAWNFHPYLQIQREGNTFFVRSSKDGTNWIDLPGSPTQRNDMDGKSVQVGLYQSTYGPLKAYGSFSHFRIFQKK